MELKIGDKVAVIGKRLFTGSTGIIVVIDEFEGYHSEGFKPKPTYGVEFDDSIVDTREEFHMLRGILSSNRGLYFKGSFLKLTTNFVLDR